MDFWNVYEETKVKAGFGNAALRIASRDRINLSLSTVEKYAAVLGMNQGAARSFSEEARYVIVKELTHDMLLSIYDVNTTYSMLLRFSEPLGDVLGKHVADAFRKINKPNLEMRIIGLQNKDAELLSAADMIKAVLKHSKPSLMEVDLFGLDTRHIAFDTKLGMSFNLLLLNRIYRPHELANTQSLADFAKKKSELKFI